MTETTDAVPTRTGSLSTLRLAELQQLAASMGIAVNPKMRKADLVSAIREQRGAAGRPAERSAAPHETSERSEPTPEAPEQAAEQDAGESSNRAPSDDSVQDPTDGIQAALDRAQAQRDESQGGSRTRRSRRAGSGAGAPRSAEAEDQQRGEQSRDGQQDQEPGEQSRDGQRDGQRDQQSRDGQRDRQRDQQSRDGQRDRQQDQQSRDRQRDQQSRDGQRDQQSRDGQRDQQSRDGQRDQQSRDGQRQQGQQTHDEDDESGGRGRRRSRNRNRDRKRGRTPAAQGGQGGQQEDQESYTEEDVLVPVGGILDLLDNYAFIRTTGYLPGPTDVYVPMGMVKRHGLRKGDAVQGAIKAPQDGTDVDQHTVSSTGSKRDRGKFSALVRLDRVNGQDPESGRRRPDFASLTPLYPQERLRLETEQKNLTTRVIDLVAPIGKGQRGLIVSPPKAGKTMVLQAIANAITTNNPEVHLMIVLVDERPEEVTDFERSVKGEVISSTFDRPASDHTLVSELAIERAKRLVELGQDVVVLLDGITRLGRAYNLAAPASGRILSGGVDSAALYPPKKFFGAARNIENGGSLTILATALVETGSKMDEVIFEEFKGTGNMELKLSRQLADRRTFPAVDVNGSGTRREEILMGGDELKIMWKLRRVLSALDQQQGIELLLDRLKKTKHNYEFLTQVQQTSSTRLDDED